MRTKRTFLNFLTEAVPLILTAFLGIFKSKIFLQVLGDQTLGLYNFFSQVMVYVGLVDGGLGSAVLFYLYKPNSKGDNKKMAQVLSGVKRVFSIIGAVVFLIAFLVSFFIPYLIKNSSFENSYVSIAFLLFAISNVVSYFFLPYKSLLEVKEKRYISNLVLEFGKVIQSALEIILLLQGVNFETVLILHSIIAIISNLLIMIITKKMYKEISFNEKKKDYSFVKEVKHLIVHKINGMISVNIDVILITALLGLSQVAIYSAYNYVINMLKNIIYKISNALTAIVGNYLVKEKEKLYDLYLELVSLTYYIATVICVPLLFALNGFIDIFYEGEIKTTIIALIAFVSYLFVAVIKLPSNIFATAGGLFKKTKICTYFDMGINLVLSLFLIKYIGIAGVVIGTVSSLIVSDLIIKNQIIHKNIFKKKQSINLYKNIKFLIISAIDLIIGFIFIRNFDFNNIFEWLLIFGIFTIINTLFVSIIYYLVKEFKFINRIKYILKKSK